MSFDGPTAFWGSPARDARQHETDLLADINRHPRVRELAANPLLLTSMALMKRQGFELVELAPLG